MPGKFHIFIQYIIYVQREYTITQTEMIMLGSITSSYMTLIIRYLGYSLLGAFFPISRIIYAMAQDGLLFKILGKIHKKYETPVIATIFSGLVTGNFFLYAHQCYLGVILLVTLLD